MRGTRLLAISVAVASSAVAATAAVPGPAGAATRHRAAGLGQLALLAARVRIQGARPAELSGVVLGPGGRPLTGACVTAIGRSGSFTAMAAPSGRYLLGALPAGSYAVEYRDCAAPGRFFTSWSGGAAWQSAAHQISLRADQLRTQPTVTLKPVRSAAPSPTAVAAAWRRAVARGSEHSAAAGTRTGQVAGIVTGNGHRLRRICVQVGPLASGFIYVGVTRKNGTYTVRHIPPGHYVVVFAPDPAFGVGCPGDGNWLQQTYRHETGPFQGPGTHIKVVAAKTTKGISAKLLPGGQISGTVATRSGKRLAGMCITADGHVAGGYYDIGITDSRHGTFVEHALFPGSWTLALTRGCGNNGDYAPTSTRPVRIRYGQHATVHVTMLAGGSITGTVTSGSRAGPPLRGICVLALDKYGDQAGSATTTAAGHYRITGLGSATYQLQFEPGCGNNGNYVVGTTYARVTAAKNTPGIDIALQPGAEISGTVIDRHAKAIAGICVQLDNVGSGQASFPGEGAITDNGGSYALTGLPAGTYDLGFSGGCGNSGSYAPSWYKNQIDQNQANTITVAKAQNVAPITTQLQPGATLSGAVRDTGGRKLAGVCIGAATQWFAVLGGNIFNELTFTGGAGTYQIANLTPGQYLVSFGCDAEGSYATQWYDHGAYLPSAELVSLPAGTTAGISATLGRAGTISGVVTRKDGRKLSGVCVQITFADPQAGGASADPFPVITGADGSYELGGLRPGRYDVMFAPCIGNYRYAQQWYRDKSSAAAATPVTVVARRTTNGVDGALTVGGSISGRVTAAAGTPLRNICAFAYDPGTAANGFAITGKTGAYTIDGLNSGRYVVQYAPCDQSVNLQTATRIVRVTATAKTSGINIVLHAGGSISGTVATGTPTATPIGAICVQAYSTRPVAFANSGFTGTDGNYVVTGLKAGTYALYFNDPTCLIAPPNLAPLTYPRTVAVQTDHTASGIDARLQPDGEVTGIVTGKSAKPVSGICVRALPLAIGSRPVAAVSRMGRYSLIDLLPGKYKIEFLDGCGAAGYRSQWWQHKDSSQAATVITVAPGQVISGISAELTHWPERPGAA